MSKQFEYEEKIICPHCEHKFSDSWEFSDGMLDGDTEEIECENCDKKFTFNFHLEIRYSTFIRPHQVIKEANEQTKE